MNDKHESKYTLEAFYPIWNLLSVSERESLKESASIVKVEAGKIIHDQEDDCEGLFIIASGLIRAYIMNDEGKEITVFRLFERDMCMFSAPCILNSIQFSITIEAERDSVLIMLDSAKYKKLMEHSVHVQKYTNELMATRFSEVMWLIEQIMWKSIDKRLAAFLSEEKEIESSHELTITHEKIASHLGTAREVVTRMLKYFQAEGIVELKRGKILIIDENKLRLLK